jgi:hypothetical protein
LQGAASFGRICDAQLLLLVPDVGLLHMAANGVRRFITRWTRSLLDPTRYTIIHALINHNETISSAAYSSHCSLVLSHPQQIYLNLYLLMLFKSLYSVFVVLVSCNNGTATRFIQHGLECLGLAVPSSKERPQPTLYLVRLDITRHTRNGREPLRIPDYLTASKIKPYDRYSQSQKSRRPL